MIQEEKQDFLVSIFEGINPKVLANRPIASILEKMQNGFWLPQIQTIRECSDAEQKKELKKQLYAFTPCGTFDQWRSESTMQAHSGLICMDFDKVNLVQSKLFLLSKNNYTFAAFRSASGTGLAWLVKIPPILDKEVHKKAFESLSQYAVLNFGLTADKSCKNLDRLRFISNDSDLFYNPHALCYQLPLNSYLPAYSKHKKNQKADRPKIDLVLRFIQNQNLEYIEGSRSDFIVKTAGFANRLGISLAEYAEFFCSRYPDFDSKRAADIYKRYAQQFNTLT